MQIIRSKTGRPAAFVSYAGYVSLRDLRRLTYHHDGAEWYLAFDYSFGHSHTAFLCFGEESIADRAFRLIVEAFGADPAALDAEEALDEIETASVEPVILRLGISREDIEAFVREQLGGEDANVSDL
jgi:hypothetical protein